MAQNEADKIKLELFNPDTIISHIHEGFDPLLVIGEIIDTHF